MDKIKRWEPENTALGYNMRPCEAGSFVLAADYDALAARIAELEEELALSNECLDMANETSEKRGLRIAEKAYRIAELEQQRGGVVPAYRVHITTPGEAVAGIALRQMGDESRWVEIRDLNARAFPGIGPNDYYPVGTVLRIPSATQPGECVAVPDAIPVTPYQTVDRSSTNYKAGWNAYRRALLAQQGKAVGDE